jgi:VanZ like family
MVRKFVLVAAWAALGLICFVTLSPQELRPQTGSVGIERFVAYATLGVLLMTAYPRHFVRLMLFMVAVALALEALQHLTADRHGHLADALQKLSGGVAGCSFARLAQITAKRLKG